MSATPNQAWEPPDVFVALDQRPGEVFDNGGFEPLWPSQTNSGGNADNLQSSCRAEELDEAYNRGFLDGASSRDLDVDLAEQKLKKAFEIELQRTRTEVNGAVASDLADVVGAQVSEMELRLRDAISKVLVPFLITSATERQITEIGDAVAQVLDIKGKCRITLSGPGELARIVSEGMSSKGFNAEIMEANHADLRVRLDDAEIRSALPDFVGAIRSLIDE